MGSVTCESVERRTDEGKGSRLKRGEPDCAAHLASERGQLRLGALHLFEQLLRERNEGSARVGQLQPPTRLAEELDARLTLEQGELLRDRRRGERERLRRAGDRSLGGELAKHCQAARIQHQLSVTEGFPSITIA